MSERSTVRFTQAGKPISCSAGFIVGVCPFAFTVLDKDAELIRFGSLIVMNLGMMPVDQGQLEALNLWRNALAEPDPVMVAVSQFRADPVFRAALGNDAEF